MLASLLGAGGERTHCVPESGIVRARGTESERFPWEIEKLPQKRKAGDGGKGRQTSR